MGRLKGSVFSSVGRGSVLRRVDGMVWWWLAMAVGWALGKAGLWFQVGG